MNDKKKQMIAMRDAGYVYREIAEHFGCSRQYVTEVCAAFNPSHFSPLRTERYYPNVKKWCNKNKVHITELCRRCGLTPHANNYGRLKSAITIGSNPTKKTIDKLIRVTGMTYDELFWEGDVDE